MNNKYFLILALVFMSGCTHSLHIAHVSDFSPTYKAYNQGELVQSRAEQKAILGFVFDTNYIDEAYAQLMQKCPNGSLQSIVSQFSTSHGFLSWTNVIDMQALCVPRSNSL